jgi:hypothetical protein
MERVLFDPADEMRRLRRICEAQEALIERLRRELEEARTPKPADPED